MWKPNGFKRLCLRRNTPLMATITGTYGADSLKGGMGNYVITDDQGSNVLDE